VKAFLTLRKVERDAAPNVSVEIPRETRYNVDELRVVLTAGVKIVDLNGIVG
jgi:hypothetical protein